MKLHVRIEIGDRIIDDEVVAVVEGLRFGEHEDAALTFPGADLVVACHGDGLRIGGHRLVEGETVRLHYGDVSVTLEIIVEDRARARSAIPFDVAMPVLLASIVLLMLTSQVAHHVLIQKAEASAVVARAVEALLLPPEVRVLGPTDTIPKVRHPRATPVQYVDHAGRERRAR